MPASRQLKEELPILARGAVPLRESAASKEQLSPDDEVRVADHVLERAQLGARSERDEHISQILAVPGARIEECLKGAGHAIGPARRECASKLGHHRRTETIVRVAKQHAVSRGGSRPKVPCRCGATVVLAQKPPPQGAVPGLCPGKRTCRLRAGRTVVHNDHLMGTDGLSPEGFERLRKVTGLFVVRKAYAHAGKLRPRRPLRLPGWEIEPGAPGRGAVPVAFDCPCRERPAARRHPLPCAGFGADQCVCSFHRLPLKKVLGQRVASPGREKPLELQALAREPGKDENHPELNRRSPAVAGCDDGSRVGRVAKKHRSPGADALQGLEQAQSQAMGLHGGKHADPGLGDKLVQLEK